MTIGGAPANGVQRCALDGSGCATWPPPAPLPDGTHVAFDAWMDEIYDGMMWTFAQAPDLGVRCQDTAIPLPTGNVARPCRSVLNDGNDNGTASEGVRPLRFYFVLGDSPADHTGVPTANVQGFYGFVPQSHPACDTPDADLEFLDYEPFFGAGGFSVVLNAVVSNPFGLKLSEVGLCVAQQPVTPPPDPGYAAYAFGPNQEITIEFNTTGDQVNGAGVSNLGVAYKEIASSGYYGTLTSTDYGSAPGGGDDTFTIGVGFLTKNGADYPIDWTNPTAARGIVTELVNALYFNAPVDTDCTTQSADGVQPDCTITTDGSGTTTVAFSTFYGSVFPFGATYAPGATHATTLWTINPGGQ